MVLISFSYIVVKISLPDFNRHLLLQGYTLSGPEHIPRYFSHNAFGIALLCPPDTG